LLKVFFDMAFAHHMIFSAVVLLLIEGLGGICLYVIFHTPTSLLLEGLLGHREVCQLYFTLGERKLSAGVKSGQKTGCFSTWVSPANRQ